MKKKRKVSIVTGGAGFIGSNLVDQLVKKRHKVIVLDNFRSIGSELYSSLVSKLDGFLKFISFFLENSSIGDGLIFCPLFDFCGG